MGQPVTARLLDIHPFHLLWK